MSVTTWLRDLAFPTRVGMNRFLGINSRLRRSIPHSRGDESWKTSETLRGRGGAAPPNLLAAILADVEVIERIQPFRLASLTCGKFS